MRRGIVSRESSAGSRRVSTRPTCGRRGGCRTSWLINDAVAQGLGDGLRLGVHLELLVNPAHVELDRVVAHAQLLGRGRVVVPLDYQLEEPRLVRRQLVVGLLGRPDVAE